MTIENISNCARCGGEHNNVDMIPLTNNFHYTHFALCPGNGQPILIKQDCNNLPFEEEKTHREILKYIGWDSIEQLEDVIGENKSTDLYFGNFGDSDNLVKYDLEITLRRVRRSDHTSKILIQ